MVKRYDTYLKTYKGVEVESMYEDDNGTYVTHTDYATLQAKCNELERERDMYRDQKEYLIAEDNADIVKLEAERDRLRKALERGRLAIGEHSAPEECYATGPLTGCAIQDLIVCPACAFIDAYDDIVRTALGGGE